MNAILNSLAILSDLGMPTSLTNIDFDWMYLDPNVLLWADHIHVPSSFICNAPDFRVDVGFEKSNEVLQRSLEQAWSMLVEAGVIVPIPVSTETHEAAKVAYYSVQNRLAQTVVGQLPDVGVEVKANPDWTQPPELLQIANEQYCSIHLDTIAAYLVVAQSSDSIWINTDRERNAIRWLYCGGMDPSQIKLRARQTVIDQISILRLPKCQFIPPVASCGSCGCNGSTCFTEDYGVDNWVRGARDRLRRILDLRDSAEVKSLRRVVDEAVHKVSSTSDIYKFDSHAVVALQNASKIADQRINGTLKDITKYCDIAALYSVPLALFASGGEPSIFGTIAGSLSGGSTMVSAAARLLLESRHSWLSLRELDL